MTNNDFREGYDHDKNNIPSAIGIREELFDALYERAEKVITESRNVSSAVQELERQIIADEAIPQRVQVALRTFLAFFVREHLKSAKLGFLMHMMQQGKSPLDMLKALTSLTEASCEDCDKKDTCDHKSKCSD